MFISSPSSVSSSSAVTLPASRMNWKNGITENLRGSHVISSISFFCSIPYRIVRPQRGSSTQARTSYDCYLRYAAGHRSADCLYPVYLSGCHSSSTAPRRCDPPSPCTCRPADTQILSSIGRCYPSLTGFSWMEMTVPPLYFSIMSAVLLS